MQAVLQHSLSSGSSPVCDAADVFWTQFVPDLPCMVSLSAHLTVTTCQHSAVGLPAEDLGSAHSSQLASVLLLLMLSL